MKQINHITDINLKDTVVFQGPFFGEEFGVVSLRSMEPHNGGTRLEVWIEGAKGSMLVLKDSEEEAYKEAFKKAGLKIVDETNELYDSKHVEKVGMMVDLAQEMVKDFKDNK